MRKNYLEHYENVEIVEQYVRLKFRDVRSSCNGYIVRCPFKNHEHDKTKPAFNINWEGQYYCHKCGEKGNLITLAKYFRDDLKKIFNN